MKLKVAVAGFGNLGKSLVEEIKKDNELQLVGIISRRQLDVENYIPFDNADTCTADVVLLAHGSYDDIEHSVRNFANFHTVDSFDTHDKMKGYKQLLNTVKPSKLSVCAVGWDPGVLSICRAVFSIGKVATFWGRGISQGHSNALRSIKGVTDAVEITEPITASVQNFEKGVDVDEKDRHRRICYVACPKKCREYVKNQILCMPNYFLGQQVEIIFCTEQEIDAIKKQTQHAGKVLAVGDGFTAQTNLQIESNTQFTAKVMLAYAKAVPQLVADGFVGACDPLDIPLRYIAKGNMV